MLLARLRVGFPLNPTLERGIEKKMELVREEVFDE